MVSKTEAATCVLWLEVWDKSEKFLGEIRHDLSSQDLNDQTMHQIQLMDRVCFFYHMNIGQFHETLLN